MHPPLWSSNLSSVMTWHKTHARVKCNLAESCSSFTRNTKHAIVPHRFEWDARVHFLRVYIPTRAKPGGAQHRCRTLLNVKSKLSPLTVDTEIHHAPHSQYRRFRPLDDSKEMRFARLTAMLRTSIAFASRSHSAHTSRNPTTSCNSKRLV